MELTGAEITLRCLQEEGVEYVFGYPGGAVLHIYDALFQQDKVKHVLVRHEQAAVHAADGYARSSDKVGVALVTSGPGLTNAVTGIATAYLDSIPLVVISGQVPTFAIGEDAFQEVDAVGITRPCVKHNYLVKDVKDIAAEKYGDKPAEELPLLFQRILQNTVRDHFRRQKVRSRWITLFSAFQPKHEEEEFDPLDVLEDNDNQSTPAAPDADAQQQQTLHIIESALSKLPARQREAFLLRYWEGMDTAETAKVMGCTEGSVKTHCSRANHALALTLKAKGIDLT